MIITSKSNPLIKEIIKLYDKKYRKELNCYLVEGIKPVDECVSAGMRVQKVICTEELSARYPDAVIVSRSVFESISSEKSPQGVLAVVELPENIISPPKSSCLLLDGLQDPGNIGTIIRTANACGFKEIYMINCADPFSPKTVRASMSGIFFTELKRGACGEILKALDGVPIICADMGGQNIFDFVPPEKFCLCIGNEGNGISREVKDRADYAISIPMESTCESLNAGVSAGIAMYQLKYNKRGKI